MSWGIIFNTNVRINRLYIKNEKELDEKIKETENLIKSLWSDIDKLVVANPKDITPNDEEPLFYLSNKVEELKETIEEKTILLGKLYILDDCKDDIDWNKINT